MFQRGAQHNHTPGRPPGASANTGAGQRAADWTGPGARTSSDTAHNHHHQQNHQQQQQQSPQQQEKQPKSPSSTSSRSTGRSPRNRHKTAAGGGGSAPSTPRGERDKSRGRKGKSNTLDKTTAGGGDGGEKGGGGGGVGGGRGGGGRASRKSRSLSRSHSKRLSAPPPASAGASSRALAGEAEAELSVDARAPGVIKLFGESVVRGAQYKAVLASTRSTSQELVKQALERYGLPSDTYRHYVLCDTVGIVNQADDTDDSDDDDEQREKSSAAPNHVDAEDDNSDPSYACIGAGESCADGGVSGRAGSSGAKGSRGWIPVSSRVLDDADRPLELQMYWKPPEGLSRRFELHRRNDVIRETSVDDTSGLNDNARRIMMSKVPPGAIPPTSLPLTGPSSPDTGRGRGEGKEGNYLKMAPAEGRTMHTLPFPNKDHYFSKSSPDSEVKYAFVCPSIYPYLLTLRGHDIHKDLVLYPLKSKTLTVGRVHRRSHVDDIGLLADDVLDLHCRIHLITLPADTSSGLPSDRRRYWYRLQVEVFDRALVFVNGQQVERLASVKPGDLLGIGHHYLFLYKDPTGGYDIPETLPWYPGAACLYARVNKAGAAGVGSMPELDISEQEVLNAMVNEVNNQEYFDLDDIAENGR